MKVVFHWDETFGDEFGFKKIPDGLYNVRSTTYSDDGKLLSRQQTAELRDGTLYVPSKREFQEKAGLTQ